MNCPDGGVCHHDCQEFCFREECCEPLTLSNLNWNWTPKTRLVLRYRGHILKVYHNDSLHQTMLKGWTVEGRIVSPKGVSMPAGTSFKSMGRMIQHLKDSVDGWIKSEIETPQYRRAHSFVRLQALTRKFK